MSPLPAACEDRNDGIDLRIRYLAHRDLKAAIRDNSAPAGSVSHDVHSRAHCTVTVARPRQ